MRKKVCTKTLSIKETIDREGFILWQKEREKVYIVAVTISTL